MNRCQNSLSSHGSRKLGIAFGGAYRYPGKEEERKRKGKGKENDWEEEKKRKGRGEEEEKK